MVIATAVLQNALYSKTFVTAVITAFMDNKCMMLLSTQFIEKTVRAVFTT